MYDQYGCLDRKAVDREVQKFFSTIEKDGAVLAHHLDDIRRLIEKTGSLSDVFVVEVHCCLSWSAAYCEYESDSLNLKKKRISQGSKKNISRPTAHTPLILRYKHKRKGGNIWGLVVIVWMYVSIYCIFTVERVYK